MRWKKQFDMGRRQSLTNAYLGRVVLKSSLDKSLSGVCKTLVVLGSAS